jgi:hypothetical protein
MIHGQFSRVKKISLLTMGHQTSREKGTGAAL